MKNLSVEEQVFLIQLYKEFSSTGLLDNVYKIASCVYKDGDTACVLISNMKKDYPRPFTKWHLFDLKGQSNISLGCLARFCNFEYIILEPTLFWKSRKKGCDNWKYIK